MQKTHKQKKLFIGIASITEICYLQFSKKANQIIKSIYQSQYE